MTDQINLSILWAATGGTTPVSTSKYQDGWVSEIPTFQNFNYMLQGLDQNMLHLAESSSFDWEAAINYKAGAKVLRAGIPYVARVDNLNIDPTTDTNNNTWVTGMIVGADFANLLETDGSKVEVGARTGNLYTAVDSAVVNSMPLIELRTTGATFDNWAVANITGELVASNLGKTGPDGRSLAKDAGNSHRLFHEGHLPGVSEVPGAVPEAPVDGKLYARIGTSPTSGTWTPVTSTVVQSAPPPAVLGAGQGWYNLDDGLFYVDINDGDSSQWVAACPPVIPRLADPIRSVMGSASRNVVMTPNPLKESAVASTVGFSATIYTGNGATQSISTGIDGSTGDFGALVWMKRRDTTGDHGLFDTVRGVTKRLTTNGAGAEDTLSGLTSFDSDVFTVGSSAIGNTNGGTYASWSWQTNKKETGLTSNGKNYTAHYNADLGFSIVGYEGDGVDGHTYPHYLSKKPDLVITKNRDITKDWSVQSDFIGVPGEGDYIELNQTGAITRVASASSRFYEESTTLSTSNQINGSANAHVAYNFTSVPGVSKVGTYVGTGAVGNYVDCGFKPAFLLIKSLKSVDSWLLVDSARGTSQYLLTNSVSAEGATQFVGFVGNGFYADVLSTISNTLNGEYIFLAFADTNATAGRTNYDRSIGGNQVTVNDGTLISYANGFDQDGENNFNEDVVGDTVVTLPAGSENKRLWVYKDQGGAYGTTEFGPLEGISQVQADKWGRVSPLSASTRTTDLHTSYTSLTGIVSSSNVYSNIYEAWRAFDRSEMNLTTGNRSVFISKSATVTLQYKAVEPRVLKSWRLRASPTANRLPRRFTVEGSEDGITWVALDSTYAASDYTGNGLNQWGDLQDTSANSTAYLYHRLNVTASSGAAEVSLLNLELNTISLSDYYNVPDGVMYDVAGSPLLRVYIGSVTTDPSGNITRVYNESVGKFKAVDAELQGDLVVHGNLVNWGAATAIVVFNGATSPPSIVYSENVDDVVDMGTGDYKIVLETDMDTLDYAITGAAGHTVSSAPNWFTQSRVGATGAYSAPTLKSFRVGSSIPSTVADCSYISVVVFGGKKTK